MAYPKIKLACVSNVFCRIMTFENVGDIELGHKHHHDHISLLVSGSVKCTVDDHQDKIYNAPQLIFIRKDIIHTFEALEPKTVLYCIHAVRNGERVEDIIDPESIPVHYDPYKIKEVVDGFVPFAHKSHPITNMSDMDEMNKG